MGKCGVICVCDSACMAEYLLCTAEYLLCTENGEGGGGYVWSLAVKISAKSNFLVATRGNEKALYYALLTGKISASVNFPVLFYTRMTSSGLSSLWVLFSKQPFSHGPLKSRLVGGRNFFYGRVQEKANNFVNMPRFALSSPIKLN